MARRVVPGGRGPVAGRSSMVTASFVSPTARAGTAHPSAAAMQTAAANRRGRRLSASIKFELVAVVAKPAGILSLLAEHAVADDQDLDVRAHEAPERILRR